MPVSRPSINFRTKQTVIKKHVEDPIVGFEKNDDLPDGWLYDIKRWCSPFDLRLPTLPRLSDSNPQGIKASEYFLPGVGDINKDLEVIDIQEKFENNERQWIPIINNGYYFRYNVPFYYYSDNSKVQYIDSSDNIDSRNVLLLEEEPFQNTPISAATYFREPSTGEISYDLKVEQKYKFSGTYTDGIENETVTNLGKIYWENVDYNKKEFVVDHSYNEKVYLRFNKDYTRTYGVEPVTSQDLAACEVVGISNGSEYQVFYLKHFPIIPDTFKLYITNGTTWTEWIKAESWFDLNNEPAVSGTNRYYLDKDLGIIYFSSGLENSVPDLGMYIVCTYTTTLRVEYEIADTDLTIRALDANTSPVSQYVNQGFVCITHQELQAANIRLTIDKPKIPFQVDPVLHGPITTGSDYAILKATVTSEQGIPVPDVTVSFLMDPDNVGYLDGASNSISVTNKKGEAFSTYQPPTSADDLGYYLTNDDSSSNMIRTTTNLSYPNHIDIIIPDLDADLVGKEDEVYIYQILKDDLLLAYDDVDTWITDNLTPPPWTDGDSDKLAKWRNEVKLEYDLKDWFEVNTESGVKKDGTIDGRKVVIYTTESASKTLGIYIEEILPNWIIKCKTAEPHFLNVGDTVTIYNSTSYNGTYVLNAGETGDPNSFYLAMNPTFGDEDGKIDIVVNQIETTTKTGSNNRVLSAVFAPLAAAVIEVTTDLPHGLAAGDTIIVQNTQWYNGNHTVVEIMDTNVFRFYTSAIGTESGEVVYEHYSSNIDSNAINPVTGETSAIVPLRPVLIEKIDDNTDQYDGYTRLIYPENSIPFPSPSETSNIIGGYWVVAHKIVDFQASCWSERYNRDIYSNIIKAKISLPDYLLGEYINEQLQKIPYGWKLFSDTDNFAAGLNGATFLTINPTTGPYKTLDLINGTTPEEWASAPFKSLVFQILVQKAKTTLFQVNVQV